MRTLSFLVCSLSLALAAATDVVPTQLDSNETSSNDANCAVSLLSVAPIEILQQLESEEDTQPESQNVLNSPQYSSGPQPVATSYKMLSNYYLFGVDSAGSPLSQATGQDAHCVHVTQVTCPTGHTDCFVAVGKSLEATTSFKEGLVVMVSTQSLNPSHQIPIPVWMKTFGVANQHDGANCALEIAGSIYVAGFGWNTLTMSTDRTLLKYDLMGNLQWQKFFDPVAPAGQPTMVAGGLEWISPLSDGGVAVGGFVKAQAGAPLDFKSYGNVDNCVASVSTISGQKLASLTNTGTELPTSDYSDFELSQANSVKKVLQIPAGPNRGKLLVASGGGPPGQTPTLSLLSSTLALEWQITVPAQSEVTDAVVDPTGTFIVMSGHHSFRPDPAIAFGTFDARFTRIEIVNYAEQANYQVGMAVQPTWSSTFGDTRSIIFDECWGLQFVPGPPAQSSSTSTPAPAPPSSTSDSSQHVHHHNGHGGHDDQHNEAEEASEGPDDDEGHHGHHDGGSEALFETSSAGSIVAACASGVEPNSCNSIPWASVSTSTTWQGEKTLAECRAVGERWKNLNLRVNAADGSLTWMRTDEYVSVEGGVRDSPQGSATEYSVLTPDGGIMGITDETDGIGFLKFASLR